MPGARMRWMVTMKLSPVRIEEKPLMKTPTPVAMTWVFEKLVRVGRVEGPAGVDAAVEQRPEDEDAAEGEDVPARQVDLGKRQVLGADHDRDEEVAQHRRNARDEEEEHHQHAVHGEDAVVGVGLQEVAGRRGELEPDQRRHQAAEREEDGDRDEVEHGDALVVLGEQPRAHAVLGVEVVGAAARSLRRSSGFRAS